MSDVATRGTKAGEIPPPPSGGKPPTRRARVRALLAEGLKPKEIAAAMGITTQGVYKHIDRLRELGELPENARAS